ncbi:Protein SLG1 [Rhizina undulata]
MKPLSTLLLTALTGYAHIAAAESDATYYGCYDSQGSLTVESTNEFNSRGACREVCVAGVGFSVEAMTNGTVCLCGNYLPNSIYQVNDTKCKQECPGFSTETCGSRLGDYFSVYLSGLDPSPDEDPLPSSTSSSSSTSTSTSGAKTSVTSGAATTSGSSSSSSAAGSGSAVNKAGAAAGAVVGVVAAIAAGAGIWIFMRKRRREKVEEEYRRSAAAREFNKKPEQDHRLEPVMLQRRDSAGSIADNQDYSRRILKVTNPDG